METKDRRKALLALLLLLGGGALGAALLFRAGDTPDPDRKFADLGRPDLPFQGAAAPAPADSEASPFDDFLKLLTKADEVPAVQEFVEEVKKQEPDVANAFEEMKEKNVEKKKGGKERGVDQDEIREFVGRALAKPKFQALVARFGQDQSFRQAAAEVSKSEPVRAALKEATARGVSPASTRVLTAISKQSAAQSHNVRGANSFSAGGGAGTPGLRETESNKTRTEAARPAPIQGSSNASDAIARGDKPNSWGQSPNSSGSDAPGVQVDLAKLAESGPGTTSDSFMSLCLRRDPSISRTDCAKLEKWLGDYGIWASCYKAKLYDTCAALCVSKPELGCNPPVSYFEACVDAGVKKDQCTIEVCERSGESCLPCQGSGPLAGNSCTAPAATDYAACMARSERLQPDKECLWEGKYNRCFCFWKKRKESDYLLTDVSRGECRQHKDDHPDLQCFYSEPLRRCQCLTDAQKGLKRECEDVRKGKWLIALARCSLGTTQAQAEVACGNRGGRILADHTCSVHPNCTSETKPRFDGKKCVP